MQKYMLFSFIYISIEDNVPVTFVTHMRRRYFGLTPTAVDWEGVANGSPVIVMYMAMKHWANISRKLIESGRKKDEPVAFICDATTEIGSQSLQCCEHTLAWICRGRRDLGHSAGACSIDNDEIGKGATDINPNPPR